MREGFDNFKGAEVFCCSRVTKCRQGTLDKKAREIDEKFDDCSCWKFCDVAAV